MGQQPHTEYHVIITHPIIPADCQPAPALPPPFTSVSLSPSILILSRLSRITSDCRTDKPSWQMSLPIQTVSRRRTVSPRTHGDASDSALVHGRRRRSDIKSFSRYIVMFSDSSELHFSAELQWHWKVARETITLIRRAYRKTENWSWWVESGKWRISA